MKIKLRSLLVVSCLALATLSCGKDTGYAPDSGSGPKKIFVTATTRNGSDIGGIAAADAACAADANKPSGGTYKAFLVGSSRVACTTASCSGGASEHTDWVLRANTAYTRSDGTEIGTTNSVGLFTFPLKNAFDTVGTNAWTGLETDWTTGVDTCVSWTTGGGSANVGKRNATNSTALGLGQMACSSNSLPIFCVQQ